MDDMKQGAREGKSDAKEAWRNRDGESLSDRVGNAGDDLRDKAGSLGDKAKDAVNSDTSDDDPTS